MNEKIKQLAEQSGLRVESWMTNPLKPFQILGSAENFEKFAQLIIQKCGQYLDSPEFIGRSDLDWSMVLNEYFGIEE